VNIGLFGGSFDPVHIGHLRAAQDAFERCGLDKLLFIPAGHAPLKGPERASGLHRIAMLQAVTDGDPRYGVSDFELSRDGPSYTVDTLEHFRAIWPDDRLFWIIGADQLGKLMRWKAADRLRDLAEFICLERPGFDPEEPTGFSVHRVSGHETEVSSSEIRERIDRGLSVDGLVPEKALVYLRKNGLYGFHP
jgi:nicotinate-nucleotide adenylyltransferase